MEGQRLHQRFPIDDKGHAMGTTLNSFTKCLINFSSYIINDPIYYILFWPVAPS